MYTSIVPVVVAASEFGVQPVSEISGEPIPTALMKYNLNCQNSTGKLDLMGGNYLLTCL